MTLSTVVLNHSFNFNLLTLWCTRWLYKLKIIYTSSSWQISPNHGHPVCPSIALTCEKQTVQQQQAVPSLSAITTSCHPLQSSCPTSQGPRGPLVPPKDRADTTHPCLLPTLTSGGNRKRNSGEKSRLEMCVLLCGQKAALGNF